MGQLEHLLTLFGSRMKAQEILLLLKDVKPVVRQGFYPHELLAVKAFCDKLGILLVESKFTVSLEEDGFSNKGRTNSGIMRFYYMSKDELLALKAAHAEQVQDHVTFGELLGYPPCCIDFFIRSFKQGNTNPQIQAKRWETNVTKRHVDWAVLSHFPCHVNCSASIDLANTYLDVISADDSTWSDTVHEKLQ